MNKKQTTKIIAEAGVNHNGSLERAIELIEKAAKAGADIVKFQTYKADKLVTKTALKFWNCKYDNTKTQHEAYSKLDKFPMEYYPKLIEACKKNKIEFLSTPFDKQSADMLVKMGMKSIKVSSSDLTNFPFLKHLAKKQLPIYLSTGAATMGEIEEAVRTIEKEGNSQIIILHCTLCYPTEAKDANLNLIKTLKAVFPRYKIGLSDHTIGTTIPIAAVALGAEVIEKHYTVDKTLKESADHWFSVDPKELKEMVQAVKDTNEALGSSEKKVFDCEKDTYLYDKRSIVSNRYIPKGTVITGAMLTCKRPGTGIQPKFYDIIKGRKAIKDIPEDSIVSWDMV